MMIGEDTMNIVILIALLLCSGCTLKDPATIPHVSGRWVGRLEPIVLYGRNGVTFDGACLKIEKGPVLPDEWVNDATAGPILVDNEEVRALDPAKLPMGKRVELSGTVAWTILISKRQADFLASDTSVSRNRHDHVSAKDLGIGVRGKPKVVGD